MEFFDNSVLMCIVYIVSTSYFTFVNPFQIDNTKGILTPKYSRSHRRTAPTSLTSPFRVPPAKSQRVSLPLETWQLETQILEENTKQQPVVEILEFKLKLLLLSLLLLLLLLLVVVAAAVILPPISVYT